MKKGVLFGGIGGVVALGAAAFVFSQGGTPEPSKNAMDKIRGTDAYYADADPATQADVGGELVANLAGGSFVKMKFDVEYRIGKEWEKTPGDAVTAFTSKASKVRSLLILMLGSKTPEQLQGPNLLVFKEELVKMLNDAIFPDKMARVEDVYLKDWVIQK